EIRTRINIVVTRTADALVENVFNTSVFDSGELHDALDVFDDLARRLVALDFHAGFWSIDWTCDARQLFTPRVLANVRWTQVEAFASDMNSNGVEIFSAKDFDARDDAVACNERLLHQRGCVNSEIEAIRFDGGAHLLGRTETFDSRTAAADVRLHYHRIANGLGGRQRL